MPMNYDGVVIKGRQVRGLLCAHPNTFLRQRHRLTRRSKLIITLQRLQSAIAIHGVIGTTKRCMVFLFRQLLWFTPARRRERVVRQERDLKFDEQWGTNTRGVFVPESAEVVGPNWRYGVKYKGCNAPALDEVLSNLQIEYEKFRFVDLGSGKGRAILVAASFPFRQIIGVEYSDRLCHVARNNVSCFPKNERRCDEIDIICGDASDFEIPEGPLVIFLFNPFGRQVMKQVVRNVLVSHQQNPRRIIVVYFTALYADLWERAGFMEGIRRSHFISIYDTQPRNAPAPD
jgi:predicted RNA methylase